MSDMIVNIVSVLVLLAAFGFALLYIYKAKKQGQKCVGCPYSKTCSAQQKASCGTANQE